MATKARIEHIAVYVNDIEAEKEFFVKHFGAGVSEKYVNFRKDFTSYFLTFADGSRLEIMNRTSMSDQPKTKYRSGFHHIAIEVGDRKDVDDATKRIEKAGLPVIDGARTTGDQYYASVVADPEGNEIEIIARPA